LFEGEPAKGQSAPTSETPLVDASTLNFDKPRIEKYFLNRASESDEVTQLFRALANPSFRKRRAAQAAIQKLDYLPEKTIKEYLNSDNAEIRFFTRSVLRRQLALDQFKLNLIIRSIAENEIEGFTRQLFDVVSVNPAMPNSNTGEDDEEKPTSNLSNLSDEFRAWMLPIAVWATADKGDLNFLKKELSTENRLRKRMAFWGLHAILGEAELAPTAEKVLADHPDLRIDRALALLACEQQNCMPVLLDLLNDSVLENRVLAVRALERTSGQWFGYVGSEKMEDRQSVVEGWKKWYDDNDNGSIDLEYFVPTDLIPEYRFNGNVFLGYKMPDGSPGLVERTTDGQLLLSYGPHPSFWAEKLANGNALSTARIDGVATIIEVQPDGKIVWQYPKASTFKCHRLANGNVFVCCQNDKRLLEINRANEIVWGTVTDGPCNDAIRMPDGNTFIATDSGLYHLDADGQQKTVFDEFDVAGIQVLPDGDLLLASWKSNKVLRIGQDGEERWRFEIAQAAYAHMKLDGTLLVASGSQGFLIYNSARELVQKLEGDGFSGKSARVFMY